MKQNQIKRKWLEVGWKGRLSCSKEALNAKNEEAGFTRG